MAYVRLRSSDWRTLLLVVAHTASAAVIVAAAKLPVLRRGSWDTGLATAEGTRGVGAFWFMVVLVHRLRVGKSRIVTDARGTSSRLLRRVVDEGGKCEYRRVRECERRDLRNSCFAVILSRGRHRFLGLSPFGVPVRIE